MRQSLYDYCVEHNRIELLDQWDEAANLPLTLHTITYGSKYKAHWRCEKGHKWRAHIYARTGNSTGCPVCAGLTVIPGENDLATLFPELAAQWHPTKNMGVTPADVGAFTHRKAWWRCETCGHEWQASVVSRTQGTGCPLCTGKTVVPGVNDLKSRFPDIAAEWDYEKNGTLTPETVAEQSNRKVWWKCTLGHSYQALISSRTADRQGCPYCSGQRVMKGFNDLATILPKIATQWHPTLNGALTPEKVTCGSAKRVWWKCNVCGYEWKAIIYSRAGAQRCGCPMCAGKVRTNNRPRYQYIAMEVPRPVINRRIGFGRDSPVQGSPPGMTKTGTDPP